MDYSVYIAKPPVGGGYAPDIYKIGMTTEVNVGDRVAALNDLGSNYPTANGANWELHEHFVFESAEQMKAFETAMMERLNVGADPLSSGATELFRSSNPDADITQAAQAAFRDLVEGGLITPTEIANLAEANDMAPPGSANEIADVTDLSPEIADIALEKSASWLFELVMAGFSVGGIGIAVWRGQRIIGWARRLWQQSQAAARRTNAPRAPEPNSVTQARAAYKAMKQEIRNKK